MWADLHEQPCFAACGRGLERLLADELTGLGATEVRPAVRGVAFRADHAALARIVLWTRLATRVLAPLASFACHSDRYLYNRLRDLPWEELMTPDETLAVVANVSFSRLRHSQFVAQRVKDAIVDRFRDRTGRRPGVDRRSPDLLLNLHLRRDHAHLALDLGGRSLHRRGYRLQTVEAPLQETVAAAIVRLSGWDGATPLVDPMCGSGTLLAEAWLAGARIAPQLQRLADRAPLLRYPGFPRRAWDEAVAAAREAARPLPPELLRGADSDPEAVAAARENLAALPGGPRIRVERADVRRLQVASGTTIVCNPPYGVRLGEREQVEQLYRDLGDTLKRNCRGATAWILCGDTKLVGHLGLRPRRRIPLWNGGLECRLVELDLY